MLLVGVGAWQLEATLWAARSESAGRALTHRFVENHALAAPVTPSPASSEPTAPVPLSTAALPACPATGAGASPSPRGTPVRGLLEIPKLGVVAPVEQGVGGPVLDAAVGHDPSSVWPGDAGKAVLEAHDVSYFASLPQLAAGDTVRYVTPCTTYAFTVSAHAVVGEGSPLYDTSSSTMALVTCWPTDALWFTPDRYVVTATRVGEAPTAGTGSYATLTPAPSVPMPKALAAMGVTTSTYSLPLGTFTLDGSPNPAWARTTSPLLAAGSGIEAFIAGMRSLAAHRLDWWAAVAPGVPPPAALVGAGTPRYRGQLDVVEHASGAAATSLTLRDTVAVDGGPDPGTFALRVHESVTSGKLTISDWTVRRS